MDKPTVFNRFGVVEEEELVSAAADIDVIVHRVFEGLVARGVHPAELRAVEQYLASGISCTMSEALLLYSMGLKKAERAKAADKPGLSIEDAL